MRWIGSNALSQVDRGMGAENETRELKLGSQKLRSMGSDQVGREYRIRAKRYR